MIIGTLTPFGKKKTQTTVGGVKCLNVISRPRADDAQHAALQKYLYIIQPGQRQTAPVNATKRQQVATATEGPADGQVLARAWVLISFSADGGRIGRAELPLRPLIC